MIFSVDNPIADSPVFYAYHKDTEVWLGLVTPVGVFAEPFSLEQWHQWLKEELERSQLTSIPEVFYKEEQCFTDSL